MRSPNLKNGEKIILLSQCTLYLRDSWQEGYLFLTNRRLIFNHVTKKTFESSLDNIVKLNIEKRVWFLGVRVRQLCIDVKGENGKSRVYIALAEPKKWSYRIKESMTLMLAEGWSYNGTDTEPTGNN
jgi:hypothetical protein